MLVRIDGEEQRELHDCVTVIIGEGVELHITISLYGTSVSYVRAGETNNLLHLRHCELLETDR